MYHIVWATYNSRTSSRMLRLNINKGDPVKLSIHDEVQIAKYLYQIANETEVDIISLNICVDHLHILLDIKEKNLPAIIRKLKTKSVNLYKKENKIETSLRVWQRKYYSEKIKNKFHLNNTIKYIKNNRVKHGLPKNPILEEVLKQSCGPWPTAIGYQN